MEFNMLEVLTVQVYQDHMERFGKAFAAIRDRVKQQIESHAPSGAHELNILILSDLLHSAQPGNRMAEGVQKEAERNPGTAFVLALSQRGPAATGPLQRIARYLDDTSVSARWVRNFNVPESPGDQGNYDLHALYTLLSDLDTGSRLRWNIDRTVFSKDRTQLVIETTAFGVRRHSLFWDSNDPLPQTSDGRYDLILMRRGVCYCDPYSGVACCGAGRDNGSDVRFLQKVHRALRRNNRSAAYLAGWNDKSDTKKWATAVGLAGFGVVVPGYKEVVAMGGESSGVYVSHGRPMSTNTLKVTKV